ncbi:MAG: hypothetical protein IJJ67_00330 [Oscillospiraceae bacterium]|nr:hypothetical protein [Oscillospiraceae bacterium]
MPEYLENFGLGFFTESEETYENLLGYIAQNGRVIYGYRGNPYIHLIAGDLDLYEHIILEKDRALITGDLDTHCRGNIIWDVVLTGSELMSKNADVTQKCMLVQKTDKAGLIPMHILNPDILPSFMEGDQYQLQVVAIVTTEIKYYANEEEYQQDVPETEDGKKFGIGEGSLIPIGFLSNHMIDILDDDAKEAEDSSLDDVVLFRGTVKKIYVGKVKFGEMDEDNSFMKCIIDTQFGDLMLIHTYNQIAEDFRKNIKVGAVVAGQCIISGDPAIDEYKDGLILDEEHNLRALRYSFVEGQSERLNNILEKDVLFTSDTTGKSFLGSDSVMDRIDVVTDRRIKQGLGKYVARMATITGIKESGTEEKPEYSLGKRCFVLADEGADSFESIVFIELSTDNKIREIQVSKDPRYGFACDKVLHPQPEEDLDFGGSPLISMITLAKVSGFIDEDSEDEEIIGNIHAKDHEERLACILGYKPEEDTEMTKNKIANLYGYLFVKAIESALVSDPDKVKIDPEEALKGAVSSGLPAWQHKYLLKAFDKGRGFARIVIFTSQYNKCGTEETNEWHYKGLLLIQEIGERYAGYAFPKTVDEKDESNGNTEIYEATIKETILM